MVEPKKNTIIIKFNAIWVFGAIIVLGLIIAFFKNRIFAVNEEQHEAIVAFEKNEKSVDILQIMLENTNENKKLVNEEREVEFQIVYEDNPNLPKGEQQTKQEGKKGKIQVTALQEYENNEMKNEEILESKEIEKEITNIIYVGTSEFLRKFDVHIGENIYLLEAEELKQEAKEDATTIIKIPRYLNVIIEQAGEEWVKVKYKENEGYIKVSNITSEAVTPLIKEKSRVAKLKDNLNLEIDLTTPSGLTLSDYKTVLSNNISDKNNIFEENAEVFYDMEQKYKINGIFIAAVGIHESAWGTSKIAEDKKNLFGYKAYDSDPYNSAEIFDTYKLAIEKVAEALAINYLYEKGTKISEDLVAKGTYYNGKDAKSVNIRYASDEEWAEKVFNYMQYLYGRL